MPEVSKKSKVQLRKDYDELYKSYKTLTYCLYEFNVRMNKELENINENLSKFDEELKEYEEEYNKQ